MFVKRSINSVIREILDNFPMGYEFGLWDLKIIIFRVYPPLKYTHADTISRRLREERFGDKYGVICINPNMSRYKIVPKKTAIQFYRDKAKRIKAKNLHKKTCA